MKIGTDIDMATNIAEGYTIIEFNKRNLIRKGVLQMDEPIRIYNHYPAYILNEIYGTDKPVGVVRIMNDVELTPNDIWELYQENKEGIDSFIGMSYKRMESEYDVLYVADSISAYCGLN